MGFYLGMNEERSSRLVLGYETKDGTKIEIFEERHSASWHLTVMRAGERSARTCQCISYIHAYSLFQNAIEMCEGYNIRH
jgi:hypothetical protein